MTFSSDLAEAQMKDLSIHAVLEADHQNSRGRRSSLGSAAASGPELEEVAELTAWPSVKDGEPVKIFQSRC